MSEIEYNVHPKKKFFAYNSDNFPNTFNYNNFQFYAVIIILYQDHLRRKGKKRRKKKEERHDVLPMPPSSSMRHCEAPITLCAQTRSANNIVFLFPVYRTAWTVSQTSPQLEFELQTIRLYFDPWLQIQTQCSNYNQPGPDARGPSTTGRCLNFLTN